MAITPIDQSKESHKGSAKRIRSLKARHPDMPAREIAKRAGCGQRNVYAVLQQLRRGRTPEQLKQYQDHRGDAFDSVAVDALLSITPAKLAKASAPALMMVAGTAFDKSQLAHGLATGINVTVLMDVVDAIRERRVVEQQALQASILNRVQSGDSGGKSKVV